MRKLVWIAVIAAALWSGYWALGAAGIDRGAAAWLEARRGEGWQAEAGRVATTGFPLAFETRLEDIALADPETGLGWQAPDFEVSARATAPTRVSVRFPPEQRIVTPFETIDIAADTMQAGLGLFPGPALALDTSDVALDGITLRSSADWTAGLAAGALATRRSAEDPLAHDIRFSATDLRPATMLLAALDPGGRLPEEIGRLELDMRAAFDVPWDRHAIEDRRPQPTRLEIRKLSAEWGEMLLEAAGEMSVDARGIPEGKVTLRAVNWRDMVAVAQAGGWLPEDLVGTVTRALEILAGLSGNPETIDAPLTLRGGLVSLGPLPIGPAPVLRLR